LTGPPGMVSGTTAAARAASRWSAVTASVRYSRWTATPSGRANRITASAVTARIDTRTRRRSGTPLCSGFIGKSYFTWRSGGANPRAHSIRPMRNASTVTRRLVVLAVAGLCASACSSGPASTPAPQAASATGASSSTAASSPAGAAPAGTETPPPGDIPDTTAYVAFRPSSRQYEVKVPEGWARTIAPTVVFFTDKLNVVSIYTVKAAAPTVASARAVEVPAIKRPLHGFALTGVSVVSRPAGTAVLVRYSADSRPDPVTGKVYKDTFERYEFYKNGTEAVMLLGGPAGADNVDPWRTITNSFRWLR